MIHIGGKPKASKAPKTPKKKSSFSTTKRHFTVVIGSKEHGLYVSSSPSSAARKAVSKLCATDKKRKVNFSIREITQGSKKKTYGPYLGYIEKLAKPIELKGRVIKYKPVAKLSRKTRNKKGGMIGGNHRLYIGPNKLPYFEFITDDVNLIEELIKRFNPDILLSYNEKGCCISSDTIKPDTVNTRTGFKLSFTFSDCVTQDLLDKLLSDSELKTELINQLESIGIGNVLINLYIPHYKGECKIIFYKSPKVLRYGEISEEVNLYEESKAQNMDPNLFLNPGILRIGLEMCTYVFQSFLFHFIDYFKKGKKIISVGSGNAYFESIMRKHVFDHEKLRLDIVCIDPDPLHFTPNPLPFFSRNILSDNISTKKVVCIKPKFRSVDELIRRNSEIVGNCFLMLIWPDPSAGYDIEAIHLLKPIGIFIIYKKLERSDSRIIEYLAGSKVLQQFLRGNTKNNHLSYKSITEESDRGFSVAFFEKN